MICMQKQRYEDLDWNFEGYYRQWCLFKKGIFFFKLMLYFWILLYICFVIVFKLLIIFYNLDIKIDLVVDIVNEFLKINIVFSFVYISFKILVNDYE